MEDTRNSYDGSVEPPGSTSTANWGEPSQSAVPAQQITRWSFLMSQMEHLLHEINAEHVRELEGVSGKPMIPSSGLSSGLGSFSSAVSFNPFGAHHDAGVPNLMMQPGCSFGRTPSTGSLVFFGQGRPKSEDLELMHFSSRAGAGGDANSMFHGVPGLVGHSAHMPPDPAAAGSRGYMAGTPPPPTQYAQPATPSPPSSSWPGGPTSSEESPVRHATCSPSASITGDDDRDSGTSLKGRSAASGRNSRKGSNGANARVSWAQVLACQDGSRSPQTSEPAPADSQLPRTSKQSTKECERTASTPSSSFMTAAMAAVADAAAGAAQAIEKPGGVQVVNRPPPVPMEQGMQEDSQRRASRHTFGRPLTCPAFSPNGSDDEAPAAPIATVLPSRPRETSGASVTAARLLGRAERQEQAQPQAPIIGPEAQEDLDDMRARTFCIGASPRPVSQGTRSTEVARLRAPLPQLDEADEEDRNYGATRQSFGRITELGAGAEVGEDPDIAMEDAELLDNESTDSDGAHGYAAVADAAVQEIEVGKSFGRPGRKPTPTSTMTELPEGIAVANADDAAPASHPRRPSGAISSSMPLGSERVRAARAKRNANTSALTMLDLRDNNDDRRTRTPRLQTFFLTKEDDEGRLSPRSPRHKRNRDKSGGKVRVNGVRLRLGNAFGSSFACTGQVQIDDEDEQQEENGTAWIGWKGEKKARAKENAGGGVAAGAAPAAASASRPTSAHSAPPADIVVTAPSSSSQPPPPALSPKANHKSSSSTAPPGEPTLPRGSDLAGQIAAIIAEDPSKAKQTCAAEPRQQHQHASSAVPPPAVEEPREASNSLEEIALPPSGMTRNPGPAGAQEPSSSATQGSEGAAGQDVADSGPDSNSLDLLSSGTACFGHSMSSGSASAQQWGQQKRFSNMRGLQAAMPRAVCHGSSEQRQAKATIPFMQLVTDPAFHVQAPRPREAFTPVTPVAGPVPEPRDQPPILDETEILAQEMTTLVPFAGEAPDGTNSIESVPGRSSRHRKTVKVVFGDGEKDDEKKEEADYKSDDGGLPGAVEDQDDLPSVPSSTERFNIKGRAGEIWADDPYDLVDPSHRKIVLETKPIWAKTAYKDDKDRAQANVSVVCRAKKEAVIEKGSLIGACLRQLISHPSSRTRMLWDFVGMVILAYDLTVFPLNAFSNYMELDSPRLWGLGLATTIYWTADMTSSFTLGYHSHGAVIMRPYKVILHYMKTWFPLDLLLVGLDWFLIVMGRSQQASLLRIGKTMSRGIRVLRLMRIVKMQSTVTSLVEQIQSERVRTMFNIVGLMCFIIAVNHYIACGWYYLGNRDNEELTWLQDHFSTNDGLLYRYTTSLHWSLTQFTPASMEVTAVNDVERTYTVCVLIFAMITFSSFVSSITQSMTHLRAINARKYEQETKLHKYLNQHGISTQLASRVWHFLNQKHVLQAAQTRTKENDVHVLQTLPASLRSELRFEAYSPELHKHPFFFHFGLIEPIAMHQICNRAITEHSMLRRQELFSNKHGEQVHMFFVEEGCLDYVLPCKCAALAMKEDPEDQVDSDIEGDKDSPVTSFASVDEDICCHRGTDRVKSGEWACEAALWAQEVELYGPFTAVERTEVLMISTTEFQSIVMKHKGSRKRVSRYGESFVQYLGQQTKCRWRTAIASDFSVIQDLVHHEFDYLQGNETRRRRTTVTRGSHNQLQLFSSLMRDSDQMNPRASSLGRIFGRHGPQSS